MTKERTCDSCNKVIEKRNEYIRCTKVYWVNDIDKYASLKYLGFGDLCMECFNKLMNKEKI